MDKSYYPLVIVGVLALILIIAVVLFLVLPIQPPYTGTIASTQIPSVSITLYAGEISDSQYGFGTEPNNLTSPGPTLRFTTSDVVNLTVVNVGNKPHAFQITNAPQAGAQSLFDANIASIDAPLNRGESKSVIFSPNIPGDSYYISPISGQSELGMWGAIIVALG
jgi:FtsP/CotA-like multicopper oxidase with cupredoxin domain